MNRAGMFYTSPRLVGTSLTWPGPESAREIPEDPAEQGARDKNNNPGYPPALPGSMAYNSQILREAQDEKGRSPLGFPKEPLVATFTGAPSYAEAIAPANRKAKFHFLAVLRPVWSGASQAGVASCCSAGSSMKKVVPLPGSEVIPILPPWPLVMMK